MNWLLPVWIIYVVHVQSYSHFTANPGEPYVSVAPTSQIIPVGQSATYPCVILGDPQPELSWRKAGEMGNIMNTTNRYVLPDGSLNFASVQNGDEGSYVCTGTSRLGSVSAGHITLTTASKFHVHEDCING